MAEEVKQIGKYEIISVLGEGAMGTVYRAKDSVIGRTVAIKVMNPEIARDKEHRQRFLREAQAAGSLQHPNVVTIYDLGELDGHLFIAMEFLQGNDLEKVMANTEPMKLQSKLDIIVDVLMGLSYAHKNGIVHRDIKPANIRVSDEGKAKIMDFGVAHLASSDMTKTGVAVGTPSYMAPEQITSGKMLPQTDIFAVGAVMYHFLAGTKPFEAPTLQSLFYRIVTEMPKPLAEVRPGLPAALDAIVRKSMAKEPEDRYPTALDMANEIISVRAGLSGNPYASTASLSGFSKAPDVEDLAEIGAKKTMPPITADNKRSWRPIAMGIGAAVILILGWVVFGPSKTAPDANQTVAAAPPPPPSSLVAEANPPTAAVPEAKKEVAPPAVEPEKKSETPAPPRVPEKKTTKRPEPVPTRVATKPQVTTKEAQRPVVTAVAPSPAPAPAPVIVAPPPAAPVVVAPPPAAVVQKVADPPVPTRSPRDDINSIVAAYARAIESRDVGAVRRAYPGISGDQARGFQQFFGSTRNINVTFSVTGLDVNGNTAEAHLVGTYEYTSSDGRTQRQPVNFSASFRRDGTEWSLRSVR
jgi:serine/threonine-protein kinase